MPLPLPTSDLEVSTPATARCGPICIFEGGSFIWRTPRPSQASLGSRIYCNTLQYTVIHCNTLQHTAIKCKPAQQRGLPRVVFIATHCNTLQHTVTYCNQHSTAVWTASIRRMANSHCNTLQHTATHCNTLQHTVAHCNAMQHSKTA